MKCTSIEIDSTDIDSFITVVSRNMRISYINKTDSLTIIAEEKYYLITNSTQMNMVVLKIAESKLIIDIIAAAGAIGAINTSFWRESNFVKEKIKQIENYCNFKKININCKNVLDKESH